MPKFIYGGDSSPLATRSVPQESLLIHDVDMGSFILGDSDKNTLYENSHHLFEITTINCFDG